MDVHCRSGDYPGRVLYAGGEVSWLVAADQQACHAEHPQQWLASSCAPARWEKARRSIQHFSHGAAAMNADAALERYLEDAVSWDIERHARTRRRERLAWWVAGEGRVRAVAIAV